MKRIVVVTGFVFLFFVLALLAPAAFAAADDSTGSSLVAQLLGAALPILVPLLGTGFAALFGWLGLHLKALIQAKVKNTLLAGVLTRLNDHVVAVVLECEQAIRPTLQSVLADGKLDAADADLLKRTAVAKVKEHLGVKGLQELLAVLGIDGSFLDSFLGTRVEAVVAKLPASSEPAPAPAAVAPLP